MVENQRQETSACVVQTGFTRTSTQTLRQVTRMHGCECTHTLNVTCKDSTLLLARSIVWLFAHQAPAAPGQGRGFLGSARENDGLPLWWIRVGEEFED